MKLSELSARPFVPQSDSVEVLREAVKACRGCELYKYATQAVFSRGPQSAQIALVGEVPGDQEDQRGAPFVGPAGEVLDRALAEVKLQRADLYVTNAVKHFKFERVGKRRIHKTPAPVEVNACRPWLEAELALVKPQIVVCLGATAARSMIGDQFRLMKQHGQWMETRWAPKTMATIHPSAVLRGDDPPTQERNYSILVEDLGKVAAARRPWDLGVRRLAAALSAVACRGSKLPRRKRRQAAALQTTRITSGTYPTADAAAPAIAACPGSRE